MNKRKLVLGSTLLLLVALVAAGTLAYFTAEGRTTNVITTGTIEIKLNDRIAGGKETDTGWTLEGVMPGVDVEKTVSVTNDGTGDAWIRVKVDTKITGAKPEPLPLTFGDEKPAVVIGYDTVNWVAGGDGYYYYNVPAAPDEKTPDLFSTVKLNAELPNEYQGCVVSINVTAQAVQVKNNNAEGALTELTAENYTQVLGWPAA